MLGSNGGAAVYAFTDGSVKMWFESKEYAGGQADFYAISFISSTECQVTSERAISTARRGSITPQPCRSTS